MTTLVSLILATGGGLSMWLAQEPTALWPLTFLAIALLWMVTSTASMVRAGIMAFIWGVAYFVPLLSWAEIAAGTWLAAIALAVSQAFFIGVLGALWSLIRSGRALLDAALGGILWVGIEQLRSSWPFGGMPWGIAGFGMVDSPLMGLAPLGSTQLVGFFVVFISVLFGSSILGMRTVPGRSVILAAIATILVFAPAFLPTGTKPDQHLRIGIVQGNVPEVSSLGENESRALIVTQNHAEATQSLVGAKPDLIVWPESASDRDIRVDAEARDVVVQIASKAGVPIVLGTQRYLENARYNDYLVVYPNGTISEPYSKSHPVPFGEYIPHRDFFRSLTTAVDQVQIDMLAGEEPALLTVNTQRGPVTISVPICFEIAYNNVLDPSVAQGAQLIVTPTNNASFGESSQPYQQFAMSRFRAEEFGRSTIQVSTSGTSGAVEPNGIVKYETELFVADARVVDIALSTEKTFATGKETIRLWMVYSFGTIGLLWSASRQLNERKQNR